MKKKILICGAGGFIGGHLVGSFLKEDYDIVCADVKPFHNWFQYFENCKNFSLDLKDYNNCLKITKDIDYIFNMACNMVAWDLLKIIKLNVCFLF